MSGKFIINENRVLALHSEARLDTVSIFSLLIGIAIVAVTLRGILSLIIS